MDIKITELVDDGALKQVKDLMNALRSLKEEYVSLNEKMADKINVKVEGYSELNRQLKETNELVDKIGETEKKIADAEKKLHESLSNVAKSALDSANAEKKHAEASANTTNTISRELAEMEKLNAKKREAYVQDKEALDISRRILGSRNENIIKLSKLNKELADNAEKMKIVNKQEKDGSIAAEEAAAKRAALTAKNRELALSKKELVSVLSIEEKEAHAAEGGYVQLSQQLELMKKAYKNMTDQEKSSPIGKQLLAEVQNLDAHLKDLAADMGEFQRNVGNYAIANQSAKKQLKELKDEMASLTLQYRKLSDEEKSGDVGKAISMRMRDLVSEAGNLRDAIADTDAAISNAASDTSKLDALGGQLNMLVAGFAVATAAASAFGMEEKETKELQASVVALMAVGNSLKVVENNLQKQSAVMIGISNIQRAAQVKAIQMETAAEGKNIVVKKLAVFWQKTLNMVAKANPYVLLATGILAVVGALVAFTSGSKKATKEQKELNEQMKRNAEIQKMHKDVQSEANKNTAEQIVKVRQLHKIVKDSNVSYNDRMKALKKLQEFVPDYHGSLTKEGKLINDNIDSIDKYIQHLGEMAKAQAYMNKLVESQTEAMDAQMELDKKRNNVRAVQIQMQKMRDSGRDVRESKSYETPMGMPTYLIKSDEYKAQEEALDQWTKEVDSAENKLKTAQEKTKSIVDTMTNDKTIASAFNSLIIGDGKSGGSGNGSGKSVNKALEERQRYESEILKRLAQSRIDILESGRTKEIAIIRARYKEKIDFITGESQEELELRRNLEEQMRQEIQNVNETYDKKAIEDEEKMRNERISAIEDAYAGRSAIMNIALGKEALDIKKAYANNEITEEEYEHRMEDISSTYAQKEIENTIEMLKTILSVEELADDERLKLELELAEAEMKLSDEKTEHMIANNKRLSDSHSKSIEKILAVLEYSTQAVNGLGNLGKQIYQNNIDKLEEQNDKLEEAYDAEIARIERLEENGSISTEEAEARKRAAKDRTEKEEEKIAKKKEEIEKKQARLAKATAIAEATMGIAQSIINVWADKGNGNFLSRSIMSGIVGALGAIQLATIVATPLAAYAKGTDDHPGGPAIVGDGGRAELIYADGRLYITPSVPTLVDLPRHAKVLPDANSYDAMRMMYKTDIMPLGSTGDVKVINDYRKLEDKMDKNIMAINGMSKQLHKDIVNSSLNAYVNDKMK